MFQWQMDSKRFSELAASQLWNRWRNYTNKNLRCKLQQSSFCHKMNQIWIATKNEPLKKKLAGLTCKKISPEKKKTHPAPLTCSFTRVFFTHLKMSGGRWSPRWSWHFPRHDAWWAAQSCGKWCSSPPQVTRDEQRFQVERGHGMNNEMLVASWQDPYISWFMKDSLLCK